MAINRSDLEAIKAAIIGAINSAAGASGTGADPGSAESIDNLRQYMAGLEETSKALERQQTIAEQIANSKKREAELRDIEIEQLKNKNKVLAADIDLGERLGTLNATQIAQKKQDIAENNKNLARLEKQTKATENYSTAMKELAGSISAVVAQQGKHDTFNIANALSLGRTIKAAGIFKAGLGLVGGAISGLIDTTINLIFKVDDARSSFEAMTGASREMALSISDDVRSMAFYGVEVDKLYESHTTLRKEMTEFSMLQPSMQREVANTGALLEKQGVAMGDYAKATQLGMKAFGMGAAEAAGASRELNDLAIKIGVTPQQMAADFAGASEQLAVFGSTAVDSFKDIAVVSKVTGLEIDKLLRISEGFDTFEGAATQAGKLNAALGGNFVNAMDLMMAKDPAKRFGMIRDAVMKTGKTFDEMDYFEKKFYVNAIDGIDSVADLAMMMSGNFDDLAGATNQTSDDFKRLADRTKAIQSITDEFKTLLAQMAPVLIKEVLPPIKEMFKNFSENKEAIKSLGNTFVGLAKIIVFLVENLKLVGLTLVGLWTGAALVKGLLFFKALGGQITIFGGQVGGAGTTMITTLGELADIIIEKVAMAIEMIGAAAKEAAPGLLALGGAVALVGAGVGIAAYGIGQMAEGFASLNSEQIEGVATALTYLGIGLGAIIGIMVIMAALTAKGIIPLAAAGLYAFGGAVALVGLGIGLAAAGIGYMAEGFSALFTSLTPENTKNFTKFVEDIATNAEGLAIGAAGLLLMSYAVSQLASSLSELPTEDLDKLSKLGGIDVGVVFDGAVENVKAMMDSINSVDTIKLAATSLIVTSAMAGNAAAAQRPAQVAAQNQKAPNVDVKVYLGTEQLDARIVTTTDRAIAQATTTTGK